MTDITEPGGAPGSVERSPTELTDPGSKTQPAEGGRDEATDGGAGAGDGADRPENDDER